MYAFCVLVNFTYYVICFEHCVFERFWKNRNYQSHQNRYRHRFNKTKPKSVTLFSKLKFCAKALKHLNPKTFWYSTSINNFRTSESDRVQFVERIRFEPEGPKSDSGICEELACQICKTNIVQVVMLNCHHATTCIQCTAPLTSCPTCGVKITRVLSVRLYLTKYFPGLCRICHVKYLSVVYLGCRHFVSCYDCAIEKNTCAVCNKFYFGLLSVRIFYDAWGSHCF